ncbi:hypothetical protein FJZ53_06310 [Candidatus Woesearchaeota archaeon]|nr:hypothetical protein [Candidatus Woesearchaeota archaeon]
MKIPKTFIPEKNLEDNVNILLEENYTTVNQEVHKPSLQASILRIVYREVLPFYADKIRVEVVDCLRISIDGCEGLHAYITLPIISSMYEKRVTDTYNTQKTHEKMDILEGKARKKLQKLEKHVNLYNIADRASNDFELSEALCKFFKEHSLEGSYEIDFQKGSSHIVKRKGNTSVGEEYTTLHDIYDKHLSKYVLKNECKGFLYNLRTGIKNLFSLR